MTVEANCVKVRCILYKGTRTTGDDPTARPHCTIYPDRIPDEVAFCSLKDFNCKFRRTAEPDPEWDEEWGEDPRKSKKQ